MWLAPGCPGKTIGSSIASWLARQADLKSVPFPAAAVLDAAATAGTTSATPISREPRISGVRRRVGISRLPCGQWIGRRAAVVTAAEWPPSWAGFDRGTVFERKLGVR